MVRLLQSDHFLEWVVVLLPYTVYMIRAGMNSLLTLGQHRVDRDFDERDAMSFADPQTITINAIPNTLPRVSSGINTGSFSKDDGTVRLTVSHSYGKRNRRTVRVDHSKIAPDPLISSTSVKYSMSTYIVCDTPITGYSIAEQKQIVDALTAYLTASSGARATQLLGGEN